MSSCLHGYTLIVINLYSNFLGFTADDAADVSLYRKEPKTSAEPCSYTSFVLWEESYVSLRPPTETEESVGDLLRCRSGLRGPIMLTEHVHRNCFQLSGPTHCGLCSFSSASRAKQETG